MRIADHAVAMQSSQALQQPSNATHQQQVVSPEAARAAAEAETERHAKQVNDTEKTENRGIQDEEKETGDRGDRRRKAKTKNDDEGEEPDRHKGACEPGKGEKVDLLV